MSAFLAACAKREDREFVADFIISAVTLDSQRAPPPFAFSLARPAFCQYGADGQLAPGAPTTVTQGGSDVTYCPPNQADFEPVQASPLGFSVRVLFTELLSRDDVGNNACDPENPDAPPTSGTFGTSCPVRLTCTPPGGAPVRVPYEAYYADTGNTSTFPVGPALVVVPAFDRTHAAGSNCVLSVSDAIVSAEGNRLAATDIPFTVADLEVVSTTPADAEAIADREILPAMGGVTFVFNAELDANSLDASDFEIVQETAGGSTTVAASVRPELDFGLRTAVVVSGASAFDPGRYTLRIRDDATIRDQDGGTFVPGGEAVRFLVQGLTAIDISPTSVTLADGQTRLITVTGTFVDGPAMDLTDSATFSSSNTTIASISNAPQTRGQITGELPGSTTITATVGTHTDTIDVTVTDAALEAIYLTPAAPAPLPMGLTIDLTATGTFSNGTEDDVTELATWGTTAASVATVSNTAGTRGVVTGVAQGSTMITATIGTVTRMVPVTVVGPALTGITINPDNPTLADGRTLQFTAMGTYSAGPQMEVGGFCTWSGNNPDVATVLSSGHVNTLGSPDLGQVTITCTYLGVSDTTTLTVGPAVLDSIIVSPEDEMLPIGVDQPFTAQGIFSNNDIRDVTTMAQWTASPANRIAIVATTGVASIPNNATTGAATVTATIGGVSDSAAVTVIAAQLVSVEITPDNPTIDTATRQLTLQGTFTDDTTDDVSTMAFWSSDDSNVASVDSTGLVTNVSPGTATITATIGQHSDTVLVTTVTPPAPEISVSGANGFIPDGGVDDAGNRSVGAAFSRTITIRNLGTASLTVTGATTGTESGCTSSVTTQPSTPITSSGNSTFTVSVTPTATGPFGCAFTITNSDADENMYAFTVVGDAGEPVGNFVSGTYAGDSGCGLGTFEIETDRQLLLPDLLDNPGTVLTLDPTDPDQASASNLFINGGFGHQCTFSLAGPTVVVACDDGNSSTCQETATRTATPEIDVHDATSRLVAGETTVYRYPVGDAGFSQPFTIENDGAATLTLGTITIADDSNCSGTLSAPPGSSSLAGGASTTFTVQVTPAAPGPYQCTISIPSNDDDESSFDIVVLGERVFSD